MRSLEPGHQLHVGASRVVRCVVGTLWITQVGDARDHFLVAGSSITLTDAGGALVEAWGEKAVLRIECPDRPRRRWRMRGRRLRAGNATC